MLVRPQSSVPAVHPCLGVEEPVQGLSALAGSVGIHSFVDLCHGVEQAPSGTWQKLRVTRFTPFVENIRNLGRGDRTGIQGFDDDVVSTLIVYTCFIVAKNPLVKALEFIPKQTYGSCCQMTQITLSKAGVFPRDLNLATEAQIITAEYFSACHQPCWERLVMAVPYSYGPAPFKDTASGQRDVQHTEIALTIVTQCMRFFRHNEPATVELIVDFVEHFAVSQRVPCFSVSRRGYFPQLLPAD